MILNISITKNDWNKMFITHFAQILCTPSPTPFPVIFNPLPRCWFLLSCLFRWIGDRPTFYVLFYLLMSWAYTCWALTLCMFYVTRCPVYWRPTCFFAGTLIRYHTHTTHSGANRLTHHINIYFHQSLCAHSNYLYYTE